MKKIFTLIATAAIAASGSAQVQVLPEFELAEGATSGKLPAGTVLVDDANLKASTVWEANCGINEANFSVVDASRTPLTKWIEVRVDGNPDASDPDGVQKDGQTSIVFAPKADMDLTLFYRTGPGKAILLTNKSDFSAVTGTNEEVGDPASEKNSLFIYSYTLEADNEYVLTQKGGTGRFYGFEYTVAGATEPTENVLASWDFTNWSDETVANLKAGANWSDDEKDNGTTVDGKCFWQVNCHEGLNADKFLTANDVVISELAGLVYTNTTKDRSLAIAVDYPSTSLGDYHGAQYLWLGAKNVNYFVIPGVPAGATIKMGIESHKTTDARGVKLTINDENLTAPDGTEVEVPTTYTEQEWIVPATAAESNDVQITNTNGCHIYFITVTGVSGSTAADDIAINENAPVEYYNLNGVRVANPESGLYIKRQGNKVQKVIVK